ncbi:MAG: hypothetical protein AAF938_25810 [Myxococcota bacterium]
MNWNEIRELPAAHALAVLADATPAECTAAGPSWTLSRIFQRRLPIQTVMFVRRLAGARLAYGKALVHSATAERVAAFGIALDKRDEVEALRVLNDWVGADKHNQTLVDALLVAFARP